MLTKHSSSLSISLPLFLCVSPAFVRLLSIGELARIRSTVAANFRRKPEQEARPIVERRKARAHLGPKNALAQAAFSWLASYLMLADPIRSNLLLIDACAESLVEICAQLRLKQRYLSIYRRFQRCIWANAATSVARWLCFTHFHFRFSSMAFLGLQFR